MSNLSAYSVFSSRASPHSSPPTVASAGRNARLAYFEGFPVFLSLAFSFRRRQELAKGPVACTTTADASYSISLEWRISFRRDRICPTRKYQGQRFAPVKFDSEIFSVCGLALSLSKRGCEARSLKLSLPCGVGLGLKMDSKCSGLGRNGLMQVMTYLILLPPELESTFCIMQSSWVWIRSTSGERL